MKFLIIGIFHFLPSHALIAAMNALIARNGHMRIHPMIGMIKESEAAIINAIPCFAWNLTKSFLDFMNTKDKIPE